MDVINVSKKELNKKGFENLESWLLDKQNIYIGRNMSFYVKGAIGSKWANPFSVKKYGRNKCLELYESYINNNTDLYNSLDELKGKHLGCWCYPEKCHGDILIKLYKNKVNINNNYK